MMRMNHNFLKTSCAVAGIATTAFLSTPTNVQATSVQVGQQQDEMRYQVNSLQQSLRATNARVDQLEKELARLRSEIRNSRSSHVPVSYNSSSSQTPVHTTASNLSGTTHHVASGDTLSSISRRYGVGLDRIIASNPGLDPHRIRIGQPISVPQAGSGSNVKPAQVPRATPANLSASSSSTYTVRPGDTLSAIARRHNTTAPQLIAMNSLGNPNALRVGQQVKVPGTSASSNRYGKQSSTPAKKDTPKSTPPAPKEEPQSESELVTAPEGYGYYQVVSRDNLYSIALSFGTTTRELRSLNKLDSDAELAVGQYLLVPVADDSLYES